MIELTEEQRKELDLETPRVMDPQTRRTYVLVSEEVSKRIQAFLLPEKLSIPEQKGVLHAAALRAAWDDPEMSVYDEGPSE